MLNLRFTAGVGVGISGACGPPLVWCARKPLPSALMSSAALALGLEEHRLPVMGLCLRPKWLQLSLLFSLSLLFLLMRVALKLRSLRLNTPPCVASRYSEYKPTSLSTSMAARSRPRNGGELPAKHAPLLSSMLVPPTLWKSRPEQSVAWRSRARQSS